MSVILWFPLAILAILQYLITWILVLLILPFAKETDQENCLPSWAQLLNTPDDTGCNQGMYEPQVAAIYNKCGWYVKTLYWLGFRNTLGGLWQKFARPGTQTGGMSAEAFVQTKGPYRAGIWYGTSERAWEIDIVYPYSSTKCGNIRLGWRVHDGSGTHLFQPRIWPITKDSTS